MHTGCQKGFHEITRLKFSGNKEVDDQLIKQAIFARYTKNKGIKEKFSGNAKSGVELY